MLMIRATTAVALMAMAGGAWAQVVIPTVRVGNAGNAGELSGDTVMLDAVSFGFGPTRRCGAVDYAYEIGVYEVTAGQWVQFLNAVAKTDTYGLYNVGMNDTPFNNSIIRSGAPGTYSYSVPADWANRPVAYISWGDAVRFANWMHNGQPVGAQNTSTTEDGSYAINGATTNTALQSVVRKPGATWVIPTEDEWYKAAYHKNNGATGNYWAFPMRSDPGNFGAWPANDVINPDPGNSACVWRDHLDECIGAPYWRTPVGEFENSSSPYGTFDQGGNVWEWTETYANGTGTPGSKRTLRGGSFYGTVQGPDCMNAAWRYSDFGLAQLGYYGVRLAKVISNDCNNNGIADAADIASGDATDYNFNGIPDSCDIAAATSSDCNGNGIPDESEVNGASAPSYTWDDGTTEDNVGVFAGSIVWLNHFTVTPGRSTVHSVELSYGWEIGNLNGAPVSVFIWSDPNGDGDPADAVVLASANSTVQHAMTDIINTVSIPETSIGPVGTSFFVGAKMERPGEAYPANVDYSSQETMTPADSWVFTSTTPIDPNSLGSADYYGTLPSYQVYGNFIVRAGVKPPVPNNDADADGTPDDCNSCVSDFNNDDFSDAIDYDLFIAAWLGLDLSADINGDEFVDAIDYDVFIAAWIAGC